MNEKIKNRKALLLFAAPILAALGVMLVGLTLQFSLLAGGGFAMLSCLLAYALWHRAKISDKRTTVALQRLRNIMIAFTQERDIEIKSLRENLEDAQQRNTTLNRDVIALQMDRQLSAMTFERKLLSAQRVFFAASEKMRYEARAQVLQETPKNLQGNYSLGTSLDAYGALFGVTPDAFYGEKYHRDVYSSERFILRSNSVAAREIVARSITNLQFGLHETLLMLRAAQSNLIGPKFTPILKRWNRRSLLSLARILANQNILPSDRSDAIRIFSVVHDRLGLRAMQPQDAFIYLEALQDEGLANQFLTVLEEAKENFDSPIQYGLLACNALITQHENVFSCSQSWLEIVNGMYAADGLAEIEISTREGEIIDGLRPRGPLQHIDGPLVSVIMPTFNGSRKISTAISSVLCQTWRNLELIIVDDGSDLEHWQTLEVLAAGDPRIILVRLETNQGAYPARNVGFGRSSGTYITVHDDDDWSHPQKIERQVRHLIENPQVIGNMSYMTRINEDSVFVRINDNPEFSQRNYSSMMIPRELMENIGLWDEINRGGDAEFHDRVHAITGKRIEGVPSAPLSFARARMGSLTAGEIRKGFIDQGRQAYTLSYMQWHQDLSDGTDGPKKMIREIRPFELPESMKPRLRSSSRGHFDIVYVTDFRFSGGNTSLVAAEIKAVADMGLRVGVAQLESPTLRHKRPWNAKIQTLLRQYEIPIITLDDQSSTSILVLRHPTIMQYADRLRANIAAHQIYLVVNNPPMGREGVEAVFDLAVCETNVQRAFGQPCLVVPESKQTRDICLAIAPGANYFSANWPGFIDVDDFEVERRNRSRTELPVIGRHSRDHRLKWPDKVDDIVAAYSNPAVFTTSVLGGADSILPSLSPADQKNIDVIPFGQMSPNAYLSTIDFWVYFHSADWTESFGMAIAEAMASGAVVIIPHYLEPMFGDGALYASPKEIPGIVEKYWSDASLYAAQSERGISCIRSKYSVQTYQEKIGGLLTDANSALPIAQREAAS